MIILDFLLYISTQSFSSQDQYSHKNDHNQPDIWENAILYNEIIIRDDDNAVQPTENGHIFYYFFLSYVDHPKTCVTPSHSLFVGINEFGYCVWYSLYFFFIKHVNLLIKQTRSCINIDGPYFKLMDSTSYKDQGYGLP